MSQIEELQKLIILNNDLNCKDISRIKELEREQLELRTKIEKFRKKVDGYELRMNQIDEEVGYLFQEDYEKVINYINNYDWFIFEKQEGVFFNKKTGVLFYTIFLNKNNDKGFKFFMYKLDELNEKNNIGYWEFPSIEDLFTYNKKKNIVVKPTHWLLKNKKIYSYHYNGEEYNNNDRYEEGKLIPVCYSLKESNHNRIMKDNKITDIKKSKIIFKIFLENDLIPIFKNKNVTEAYKKIYKRRILLDEIYKKVYKPQNAVVESAATGRGGLNKEFFNYKELLNNYDLKFIEQDLVEYFSAIRKWTNNLLNKLNKAEDKYKDIFIIINQFSERIELLKDSKYNKVCKQRNKIFEKYFSFSKEDLYKTLFDLSEKAEEQEKIIDKYIYTSQYDKLAEIENQDRASFYIIAKRTGKKVNEYFNKIENMTEIMPIVEKVYECHKRWNDDYQSFINKREQYVKKNKKNDIEEKITDTWYNEWEKERLNLEYKLDKVFEGSLRGIIDLSTFVSLVEQLENYKYEIDNFFENERIDIYKQCILYFPDDVFELQEGFELRSVKFKLLNNFMESIEDVLFNTENNKCRRWLLSWSNLWYSSEIGHNLRLLDKKEFNEILKTITTEIGKMRKNNMKEFYNDVQAFIRDRKKRNNEFNALLFKMRRSIRKDAD